MPFTSRRPTLSRCVGFDGHTSDPTNAIPPAGWRNPERAAEPGAGGTRSPARRSAVLAAAALAVLALAGCDDVAAAFDSCQPLEADPGTIAPIVPCS